MADCCELFVSVTRVMFAKIVVFSYHESFVAPCCVANVKGDIYISV